MLQDVLTCIREHCTIFDAGRRLEANAERHLKTPGRNGAAVPRASRRRWPKPSGLLGRIDFSLDELKYNYPEETIGNGETAQQTLERLAWEGANSRYPNDIPEMVGGRGRPRAGPDRPDGLCRLFPHRARHRPLSRATSAASSARAAARPPIRWSASASASPRSIRWSVDLVFGRFLSTERDEPPDIDVDFEHERREEVMQYIYEKYGRHRAGLTANVIDLSRQGRAARSRQGVRPVRRHHRGAQRAAAGAGMQRDADPQKIRALGFDPDDPTLGHGARHVAAS